MVDKPEETVTLKESERVDILLLKYYSPRMETDCLSSLIYCTDWLYTLRVVDNRGGTKNMARLWNQFVRTSKCDWLCVIDSDAIVQKKWLSRMMTVLTRKNVGVVVPVTDNCNEHIQLARLTGDKGSPFPVSHGQVSGFCFLFRKEAYQATGPFDEGFAFYGQDTDWFTRMAHQTKWGVWIDPRVFVKHYGHYSTETVQEDYDFEADKRYALDRFFSRLKAYQRARENGGVTERPCR